MVDNLKTTITLEELKDILDGEILFGGELLSVEIKTVFGSDLMSDVLTFIKPGSLLLTGLTNPQVVRTAEMSDIVLICFVCGKRPQEETINLAREKNIPLLMTDLSMYESCGRLFEKGLPHGDNSK